MKSSISLVAAGHATSLFLAISFSVCVFFDLIFPQHQMYAAWERLLPGFQWIRLGFVRSRVDRELRLWLVYRADLGAALQRAFGHAV